MIRKDLLNTNWNTLFFGLNANEMSLVFTDTLLNIFSKHISNKIIICDDNLLRFFENYLHNRYQRVVLNGTTSNWRCINASVPQGTVLGPLPFLVYINDLTDNLLADDSSLFTRVDGVAQTQDKLIKDLQTVTDGPTSGKCVFN